MSQKKWLIELMKSNIFSLIRRFCETRLWWCQGRCWTHQLCLSVFFGTGDCPLLSSADSWQSAFVKWCLWSSLLLWSVGGDCLLLLFAYSWQSAFVKCYLWSSLLLWSVGGDCLLLSSFVRLVSGQVDGNGGCGGARCMAVFQYICTLYNFAWLMVIEWCVFW